MIFEPTVIDLFSGCGGLSYGMSQAGFRTTFGIDYDLRSLQTFNRNHPESNAVFADIALLKKRDFSRMAGRDGLDVLIGGPPCQGVSLSGHRLRKDPRNELFCRIYEYLNTYDQKHL